MCDKCRPGGGTFEVNGDDVPPELVLMATGFAIGKGVDDIAGPDARKPITAMAVTGQLWRNDGWVHAGHFMAIDLLGLAQMRAQIEHYVTTMPPEARTQFTHLYDQAVMRVRETMQELGDDD